MTLQSSTFGLGHSDQIPFMKLFSDSWFTDRSWVFGKRMLTFYSLLFPGCLVEWDEQLVCSLTTPVCTSEQASAPGRGLWHRIVTRILVLVLADMLVSFNFVVTTRQPNHRSISIPWHELYGITMCCSCFCKGRAIPFHRLQNKFENSVLGAGKMLWGWCFNGYNFQILWSKCYYSKL